MIYLGFYSINEAQNAHNARTLETWFDDKLREVCATNDFFAVRRWQLCL